MNEQYDENEKNLKIQISQGNNLNEKLKSQLSKLKISSLNKSNAKDDNNASAEIINKLEEKV